MPTVTVTYVDGTTRTYHPQVARFGGIDLQILGDPDHWPELLVPRAQLTRVTSTGTCGSGTVTDLSGSRGHKATRVSVAAYTVTPTAIG